MSPDKTRKEKKTDTSARPSSPTGSRSSKRSTLKDISSPGSSRSSARISSRKAVAVTPQPILDLIGLKEAAAMETRAKATPSRRFKDPRPTDLQVSDEK